MDSTLLSKSFEKVTQDFKVTAAAVSAIAHDSREAKNQIQRIEEILQLLNSLPAIAKDANDNKEIALRIEKRQQGTNDN